MMNNRCSCTHYQAGDISSNCRVCGLPHRENIIDAWLEKNGDPEIEKQVEREAEDLALELAAGEHGEYIIRFPVLENPIFSFKQGAKWMKKRSFTYEDMIKASEYGYNFHKTTSFPEQEFKDSCINNTKQWLMIFKKK